MGGGPSGFLLPFRLLGSGASWGEITSSAACPPPPQLPLPMAPFSLPRAPCCGRVGSVSAIENPFAQAYNLPRAVSIW